MTPFLFRNRQRFGINKLRIISTENAHQTVSTEYAHPRRDQETDEAPNLPSAWRQVARQVAVCLSETVSTAPKELSGFEGTSTGWAAWIDESTSKELQNDLLDRLELSNTTHADSSEKLSVRGWMQWISNTPKPFVWDVSLPLRKLVKREMTLLLQRNHTHDINETASRVSCRFMSIPSRETLLNPLDTPVGTMVFGKVLSGGAERFRLLGSSSSKKFRKVGQRVQIANVQKTDANPCWLQYGGSRRSYKALDMGPCLVWELALQPEASEMALMGATVAVSESGDGTLDDYNEMFSVIDTKDETWMPMLEHLFELTPLAADQNASESTRYLLDPEANNVDLVSGLSGSLGGLETQVKEIVRRVLDGRVFVPFNEDQDGVQFNNTSPMGMGQRQKEMKTLLELGIQPVRGLLLYGAPGTGKTLAAREICKLIRARPPKIAAAPDLLDRWVGGTERLVRDLFADAEEELKFCQGDATRSSLHVVVIDECDALFRKRSSSSSASEVTRASAVNQVLSKLDGIRQLNNVLVIAMTNKKELLDPALLRPGRLEVCVEFPLPDASGRREILQIQLNGLKSANRLSQPLLESVYLTSEDRGRQQRNGFTRDLLQRLTFGKYGRSSSSSRIDLSSDAYTGGFTGADLAGLVRNAGSRALSRWRSQEPAASSLNGGSVLDGLVVTLPDFLEALEEIKES